MEMRILALIFLTKQSKMGMLLMRFLLMKKIWKTQAMVGLRVMKKTTYQIQRDSLMQRWWKGDVLAGKKTVPRRLLD